MEVDEIEQLESKIANRLSSLYQKYMALHEYKKAAATLREFLKIRPTSGGAMGALAYTQLRSADWSDVQEKGKQALSLLQKGGACQLAPLMALSIGAGEALTSRCARELFLSRTAGIEPLAPIPMMPKNRLNVGILSSDFREHASAYVLIELLDHLPREAFHLTAIDYGQNDKSALRQRLEERMDAWCDIGEMGDLDAAWAIRHASIDILLDVKGFTEGSAEAITAHRPAPLQVRWIGHPGTMGSDLYDYLIADDFVIPKKMRKYYSEKVIALPDAYQLCSRPMWERETSRSDHHLPDEATVLCCFNSTYKITPPVFDVWMDTLKRSPKTILWLLKNIEEHIDVQEELSAVAAKRGVDPERLVFAPTLPQAEHLERYRHADLFLDTWDVGACATCCDALWGGCPVLTLAGKTYAGRASGSMLHAAGLGDLVTTTFRAYEKQLRYLCDNPSELDRLRERTTAARTTAPLFDAPRFGRNFGELLNSLWQEGSVG